MSSDVFSALLKRVAGGETLSAQDSARAFGAIMAGAVGEMPMAAFLGALAVRRPAVAEIVGAAQAMRATMKRIEAPAGAIDLCGTGGDGFGTLNISTACAFAAAGAGVPVAKHGNRNMSSKSGAADVLEALGVDIDLSPEQAQRCLEEAGVCFLFAQTYHPAMKYAAPVRQALGFRTIFNLLGPISSPAGVTRQLVGVYAKEWIEPLAHALKELGTEKAWIVHGRDGLDEMTTTDTTSVAILENGMVRTAEIAPEEIGVARATMDRLKGGTAAENAAAIRRLFAGEQGAYRDIVVLNCAAALVVARRARDLKDGAAMATESIASGRAGSVLAKLIAVSQSSHA